MISLILFALIAALTEALLHFIPWNRLLGNELRAPVTYIVGLAPLLAIMTAWLYYIQPNPTQTIVGLWSIFASGGAGVLVGYVIDGVGSLRLLSRFDGRR